MLVIYINDMEKWRSNPHSFVTVSEFQYTVPVIPVGKQGPFCYEEVLNVVTISEFQYTVPVILVVVKLKDRVKVLIQCNISSAGDDCSSSRVPSTVHPTDPAWWPRGKGRIFCNGVTWETLRMFFAENLRMSFAENLRMSFAEKFLLLSWAKLN